MTYDGDFASYSDGAGAHQQGLDNQHVIIVHDPVPVGRWPRRRGLRFDVTCEGCGWSAAALYHQLAIDLAWEHASYTHGTVMQSQRGTVATRRPNPGIPEKAGVLPPFPPRRPS